MNEHLKYTKDGIEVDVAGAMHYGDKKKQESKGAPDISKHYFKTKEEAMKDAEKMGLKGVHSHKSEKGETLYMAGPNHGAFMKKHKEMLNKSAKAGHYGDKKKAKAQWDKINKKELKQDDKKEKVEHEKDAVKDDKSKIKKLDKGAPSKKKSIEKKDLKKDVKFDKDSEKEMKADKKPKMSYAEILIDLTEKFGLSEKPSLADFKKPTKED